MFRLADKALQKQTEKVWTAAFFMTAVMPRAIPFLRLEHLGIKELA